jgi:flagellar biogenesis protein FliO
VNDRSPVTAAVRRSPSGLRLAVAAGLLLMTSALASPLAAQTDSSTAAGNEDSPLLIRRSHPADAPASPGTTSAAASPTTTRGYAQQVIVGLALVLALILAMRWLSQYLLAGSNRQGTSRAVRVLWRSVSGPKQQLMLLQVGRRLLVVANAGGQMNTLCEIGDPEEVAALLGQVQQEKPDSVSRTFATLFGRAERMFHPGRETAAANAIQTRADETTTPADGREEHHVDPAMGVTKQELSGLVEKVRGLSRQFRA